MIEKVIIFLLMDGGRSDIIDKLLADGRLPNLAKILIPFFLGKYPGDCNIPGIRWMERYLEGSLRT